MAVFVTGDTHGADRIGLTDIDGFMPRFRTRNFPEQKELSKTDYVIICGDFGGIWLTDRMTIKETPKEKHDLDWLNNKPFTTLFVPGNHENYNRLTGIRDNSLLNSWLFEQMPADEKEAFRRGYPRFRWHGGYVRRIRPSVLMLEPGVFEIDGVRIFAYGGAASHDIQGGILNPADFTSEKEYNIALTKMKAQTLPFRIRGISWWEQELPGKKAEQTALKALENAGWMVDFIFTHDCTSSDRFLLGYDKNISRLNDFLEIVKQKTSYRHWFFGHLHDNRNLPGGKEHLIYEQIIRIL